MSEDFKLEYKIFEDINLENNKIINVSEISSYDGSGKYSDDVKKSGLYIHTPGNLATKTQGDVLSKKDKGLIVTTGHAQTRLDTVDNISDTIDSTVKSSLIIKSETKTDFVSPNIDIKSADNEIGTEIHIKQTDDSISDEGITITTDRAKIISTKSENKTNDKNDNAVILDFSNSVPSHIDLNRADIYQANTEVFVAGTKYGYSSDKINIIDGQKNSSDDESVGNALYVNPEKVNIYVNTSIKNSTTDIIGKLVQTGAVEINKGVHSSSSPSTTIDGSSLDINTKTVNVGNLTSESIDVKTTNINIGTAKTDISKRNTINIGSDFTNLTIKGRDFLIDSEDDNLYTDEYNKKENKLSNDEYKSYLRSYYINSNNIYAQDLLTIGSNGNSTNSSHLQLNGIADITGNLDVDNGIDVKDTIWFHSDNTNDSYDNSSKTTTSYVKSNNHIVDGVTTENTSLQINNDKEVIISNGTSDSTAVHIVPKSITTGKKLILNADQDITGTLEFKSKKDIINLKYIKTDTLEVSNNELSKNSVFTINTSTDSESFKVDSDLIYLKNNDTTSSYDSKTSGTINDGRLKQTGNTYINTEDTTNELIVKGSKTSIESTTVNIGSDISSSTNIINIGTVKTGNIITIGTGTTNNDSNIIVKGKDLELTSTGKTTGKSVSYLRVSDINTDTLKVNDSIIVGEKPETNNSFKLYGNADISNNLDVHNIIYIHSDDVEESSSVSYIQSKTISNVKDKELVINNDTKVTISNGSTDDNEIHIEPNKIDTKKSLDLNASQTIEGTLTFDGSNKSIIDLNTIQTGSLSIQTEGISTDTLSLKYENSDKSITIKSDALNITSKNNTINGNSDITGNIDQTGDNTITGSVKINDETATNTTDIDGSSVNINPVEVNIGRDSRTENISLGHGTSNVSITGDNRFRLESKSSSTESKITVDKVAISNASNSNKVNIYWDPATSTLIFEKE